MSKLILDNIKTVLTAIPELQYVGENCGQLDENSTSLPTEYPLALISIDSVEYTNIGWEKKDVLTPKNRQMGTATIVVSIANEKPAEPAEGEPDQTWQILDLLENVHAELHGLKIDTTVGFLMRSAMQRVKRIDEIQQYNITYTIELSNV